MKPKAILTLKQIFKSLGTHASLGTGPSYSTSLKTLLTLKTLDPPAEDDCVCASLGTGSKLLPNTINLLTNIKQLYTTVCTDHFSRISSTLAFNGLPDIFHYITA